MTRPLALLAAAVFWGALLGDASHAQTACPAALLDADAAYRAGQLAEVETRLEPCLLLAAPPQAALRLLALSLVRRQRVEEAQEVVLRILAANPAYEADPVQDPPVYVSLVALVRRQVGPPPALPPVAVVPVPEAPPAAPPPAPPAAVVPVPAAPPTADLPADPPAAAPPAAAPPASAAAPRRWALDASLGFESYDGERRRVGFTLGGGFVVNGGPSPAVGASFALSPRVAVDARLQATRLPRLLRDGLRDDETGYDVPPGGSLGEPAASYPLLDPATTSRWVPSLALGARATARPFDLGALLGSGALVGTAALYGRLAARGLVRRVNGELRAGVGPAVGVGAFFGRSRTVFAEAGGVVVWPDDALDAAVFRNNGDLLLGIRLGVRLR